MRTKKELLNLLNPNRSIKNKWQYVPVEYSAKISPYIDEIENWIELHELYFDSRGGFIGISEIGKKPIGADIEDLKRALNMMLKGSDNNIITSEEKDLIFKK